MLVMGWICDP